MSAERTLFSTGIPVYIATVTRQAGGPCADSYSFELTLGWLAAERAAIGANVGANGYTTVEQADELATLLDIRAGSVLLDLGSGRGWPGAYIAEQTGASVVLVDTPRAALREAARSFSTRRDVEVVQASGSDLPFAARTFDAITHADVLC